MSYRPYHKWKNGKRPPREYVVTSLGDCVCWADLYKLAKWWLIGVLDRSPRYCWSELCYWAFQRWNGDACESNWHPSPSGKRCREESQDRGQCYCCKFRNPSPAGRGRR